MVKLPTSPPNPTPTRPLESQYKINGIVRERKINNKRRFDNRWNRNQKPTTNATKIDNQQATSSSFSLTHPARGAYSSLGMQNSK
mmetsp:Transcript_36355/g.76587  ORF Transcript_36355/g.76587 Transcript_36355/m.76587 type:complete len:85 (+) Transcript_36355:325-579(+)